MASTAYRPDIDGLRAIAVLSVFLYHLNFDGFGGGFVGVDIFFVISGYLITKLIRDQVQTKDSFSYSNFYIRRARRLFPALFVTLLATTALAVLLFSPQHLERYGGSLVHAISSVSNIFFWSESGYFDQSSRLKPLLHTWSLSVEEQFYLVWPITIVYLLKAKNRFVAPITLLLLGAGSLYINPIFADGKVDALANLSTNLPDWLNIADWFSDGATTLFYLLPFRIFEFVIGGLLVWVGDYPRSRGVTQEIILSAGLLMIGYSAVTFTEDMIFPSFNALVPCIGAALAIYAGRATYLGRILSNPLSVGIGLISYSLYLVHWPIIVFWEYSSNGDLDLTRKFITIIIGIALAYLMYKYVEQPFRGTSKSMNGTGRPRISNEAFGLIVFALSIVLFIPASNMWSHGGWSWRLPEEIRSISENLAESRDATWAYMKKNNMAVFPKNAKANLVIVGDSHGKDLFNAFSLNENLSATYNIGYVQVRVECIKGIADSAESITWSDNEARNLALASACPYDLKMLKRSLLFNEADKVFASFRWIESDSLAKDLLAMNSFVQNRSNNRAEVEVFGRTVEFKEAAPELVMNFGRTIPREALEEYAWELRTTDVDEINETLETASNAQGLRYIDKPALLCDKEEERCNVLTLENKLIYFDAAHWTLDGARWVGEKIVERKIF